MPILELQQRARELGRIRLGQKKVSQAGKEYPAKLDRFRLTSPAKHLLEKVAELYGGEVAEWTPQGGTAQWEVVTTSTRLPIMVPPQPVTQWMETWSAAGCVHRCDGKHNVLTDEDCDPEDRDHINAVPTTRLNVVLRDVEGLGVWRLESHGWNAAVELPHAAEFLAQVGGYVEGWVALEERTSKAEVPDRQNGGTKIETRRFMVPTIEIAVTPAALMAGNGRVAAPALAGGPAGHRPALAAAGPDYVALAANVADIESLKAVWERANEAGHMTQGLQDHFAQRAADIRAAAEAAATPQAEAPSWAEAPQTAVSQGEGSTAEGGEGGRGTSASPSPEPAAAPEPEPEAATWEDPPGGAEPTEDIVDAVLEEDLPAEQPPVAPPVAPPAAAAAPPPPTAAPSAPSAGPLPDDPDVIWDMIVAEAGRRNTSLPDLQDDFTTFFGGTITSAEASGAELGQYLEDLRGRA